MIHYPRLLALCLLSLISISASAADKPNNDKPNVVFFLVDDLGARDLGYTGSTFYESPNIDKLAANGTVFTNAYAACPVCSPTRASIMAGKYPARMATTDWFGAWTPERGELHSWGKWHASLPLLPASYVDHLPHKEITLAEAFKEAGYATGFFGKWHMGGKGFEPQTQGFDLNIAGNHKGNPGKNGYISPYNDLPNLPNGPEGEYLTDRLAEEVSNFIIKHKDEPFFAYFCFYNVHTPLIGRPDLVEKFKHKQSKMTFPQVWGDQKEGTRKVRVVQEHAEYAAMIYSTDMAVGRVMQELEKQGLSDNTIIVFFSDNGGLSTSEGHPTSNLELRAGKGWLYEGGIREPCIISWPKVSQPGSVIDEVVVSTDFYPTLLEACGLPLKPKQHIDGLSLTPLLKQQRASLDRDAIYWHYPHYGNQGGSPGSAIRSGDWKLVQWFDSLNQPELYNLAQDPSETRNLAKEQPKLVQSMLTQLQDWRLSVDARYPSINPNGDPNARP